MDILSMLLQAIQSIGAILILGGMLIAFLWKLAAIIDFIFGFILTLIIAYVVYSIQGDLISTAVIFIVGLGVTSVIAALGAITCILEGFALSALGFWGVFVGRSPYSSFSSSTIIGAIIASVFSTGIAVFLGGRMISTRTISLGKKSTGPKFRTGRQNPQRSLNEETRKPSPIKVEVLPSQPSDSEDSHYPKRAMVIDRQEFLARKNQISRQLENLRKERAKGKISEATGKKLQEELEKELGDVDKDLAERLEKEHEDFRRESLDLENEIAELKDRLAALESEKGYYLKQKEELEVRFRIKQIAKKDYKTRDRLFEEKITQINLNIDHVNNKGTKLWERKRVVDQYLNNKKGEQHH